MRRHSFHLEATLFAASLALACSGRNTQTPNRMVEEDKRGTHQRIVLQGCVQPANTSGEYVLRNVFVPPATEQPQGHETVSNNLIPNGSWVRLTANPSDLKSNVGKRVSIWGEIEDTGQNTLGTSGRTTPAKEGVTPPKILVEKIHKIADSCQ
jgi:hypothetical protein